MTRAPSAWSWTIRKAEAPCSAPTSAGGPEGEVVFLTSSSGLKRLEGLGAGARQKEKRKRLVQPRQALEGQKVKSLF